MLTLTHAALASFSAATTSVVFSPTGRSACVRKVVAPCRFRHEPYGARVIPILTGGSSFHASCAVPMTFTPYPSASSVRSAPSTTRDAPNPSNKQQVVSSSQHGSNMLSSPRPLAPLQAPVAVATTSSKWTPALSSMSLPASACNSGRSTNALSISSNCSRMGSFFLNDSIRAPLDDAPVDVVVAPIANPSKPERAHNDCAKVPSNQKKSAKRSQTNEAVPAPVPATPNIEASVRGHSPTPAPPAAVTQADDEVEFHAPGSRFAVVKFKYESATFVAPFKIAAGDIVVVEGDRGENIGTVAEIQKDAPVFAVAAKVLRRATDKDLAALKAQREREAAATLATRAVAESLGLHGRVEDAEYQFDLNKLTIFVSRPTKSTFVDFRKLQRTLFREFRCRIWCAYMDEVEAAEAGPRLR